MNILYIPDCYYLSNSIFLAIAKQAKKQGHVNIYFDTKDSGLSDANNINNEIEEIIDTFDRCCTISKHFVVKQFRDIKNLLDIRNFKRKLHIQLECLKPDVIIVTTDMGGHVNRMCNNWAAKNNVPYIVMQPSFLEAPAYNCRDTIRNKIFYVLLNKLLNMPLFRRQEIFGCEKKSNYLFLWGKDFKKMYKNTVIENNIRLIGNPVFDNIESRIDTSLFKTPVALLCPSMFKGVVGEKNELKIQEMYQNIVKQNPNVHFIVKVHPRETVEQYEELFKGCYGSYWITKHVNLYELFRIVDVQISLISYSSFEAIVAGIPVILLGTHILKFPFNQFNHKAIFSVDGIEEFNWALDRCLGKKYIRQFKKLRIDYLSTKLKYLGNSAEHIINEIEAIVE